MLRNALPIVPVLLAIMVAPVSGQISPTPVFSSGSELVALPPLAAEQRAVYDVRAHALLRTAAILASSAAGFYFAQERQLDRSDELLVPIVAGAAAGAVSGLVLSDASPLRVIAGAALATVPAGAIAAFVAGSMDDDEQNRYPLLAFTVPQGLLTSGFAQNRARR